MEEGTYINKTLEIPTLETKAYHRAFLTEDQRRQLRNGLAVNVVPINLVEHVSHAHEPALFGRSPHC
jgi:hypothetical protein